MEKIAAKPCKDRKLNRWTGYDYTMPGQYFVTICTQNRVCHFGEVADGKMVLNDLGEIIKQQWLWLAEHFNYIKLDEWVTMPNHFHGIVEIINENYHDQDVVGNINAGLIFKYKHSVGNGRDGKIFGETHNVENVLERSLRNPNNPKILPLYRIIGAFKTTSSKLIHRKQKDSNFIWQKSFHDRVIRNEEELINIRYYIQQNPVRWHEDENNPSNKL